MFKNNLCQLSHRLKIKFVNVTNGTKNMKKVEKYHKEWTKELYSEYLSIRKVAKEVGLSRTTIHRILLGLGSEYEPKSKFLRSSFYQILEYSNTLGIELDKMGVRERYRWFRDNGFRGSFTSFRRYWDKHFMEDKKNNDREDDL